MINIRPATSELLESFYGYRPKHSMKAVVGLNKDEVIGVGGAYIYNGYMVLFSDFKSEVREHYKLSLMKGVYKLLKILKKTQLPLYALCDRNIEGADRLLRHIGFEPINGEIYKWQRSPRH